MIVTEENHESSSARLLPATLTTTARRVWKIESVMVSGSGGAWRGQTLLDEVPNILSLAERARDLLAGGKAERLVTGKGRQVRALSCVDGMLAFVSSRLTEPCSQGLR